MKNSMLLNIRFWEYEFFSPHWMWLLLLVPVVLFFRYYKLERSEGVVKFSQPLSQLKNIAFTPIKWVILGIYACLGIGLSLLIFAMALPVFPFSDDNDKQYDNGIDIMISMDVSLSMLATDFLPNRLEAAKEVAKEFVDGRSSDRIGFVVFEGEAYTACPPTRNYDYLKQTIDEIQSGKMEPGTAIGTGLGTAVARLRNDTVTSKVIILLTDGDSNRGELSPLSAAELAKNKGITVYTIGVGKKGIVKMPINTPFGQIYRETQVNIDEGLLEKIATSTGGAYFRATDKNSLRTIYDTIDKMETRKMVNNTIKREPPYRPDYFLIYGLILIFVGFVAEQLLLKKNA
ncbi:VWA domain-containing protein [Brumimicrobium glaciale]|uniref:VWA domain-containing protein n=2 Tax=Brumimicrobium glaciale TaxID=200475 RepID=A0A4Q4KSL5_9FLAO|nr:VWA domain-containing protein [Brumimicrobium glaciale]